MRTLDPQSLTQHVDRLYRAAWALCGSREDAEDLVQETFARVLARPRRLSGENELYYLMRVLRNTFLTSRRTASRRPVTAPALDDVLVADPRQLGQPERALEMQEVYAAIAALGEDRRLALVAVDVLGLSYREAARALRGATEETATGLVRLRAMAAERTLRCPVLAINETLTERLFNDRYGTGQSTLDGILRATNLLLAGRTVVVLGYGSAGRGVAQRAKGAGAAVIVCEVDPVAALEARMEGFQVMSALAAAAIGEVFITVTGVPDVLRREHFELMGDGAVLANAGHFDVEISLAELAAIAAGPPREVLPLVDEYEVAGRRLHLLAKGRVVNLAAAAGHPASVMDLSFAAQALALASLAAAGERLEPGVHAVAASVDDEVARLKLATLGVEIDTLSGPQERYLRPFGRIH